MTRGAVSPRVLVVGDVMIDFSALLDGPIARGSDRRARILRRSGGSAATQAVWLGRLGVGVDFVGRVGAADLNEESEALGRFGVTPHLVADGALETGRLIAIVEPSGERSFLTDRGANEALDVDDIPDALIEASDHIHLSGYSFFAESPRAAVQSVMHRAGGRAVSIDPASAEFLREVGAQAFFDWTKGAAMLFPNAEEAAVLAQTDDPTAQGERLVAHYPLVVIKRGADGCEAWRGAEHWRAPSAPAKVVDTTGAGDAFVAGFLAAALKGGTIADSLRWATAAGAAAVEFAGGRPPLGEG